MKKNPHFQEDSVEFSNLITTYDCDRTINLMKIHQYDKERFINEKEMIK